MDPGVRQDDGIAVSTSIPSFQGSSPVELCLHFRAREIRGAAGVAALHGAGKEMLERHAADIGREFERQLVALELRVLQLHALSAYAYSACHRLVLLLERKLVVDRLAAYRELRLPHPCDF